SDLSGYSVDSLVSCGSQSFRENVLITHHGISGPAILQASLHWRAKQKIKINLMPEKNMSDFLLNEKKSHNKKEIKNLLTPFFSEPFLLQFFSEHQFQNKSIADAKDQDLIKIGSTINNWELIPSDTMGYDRAEVTRGGVSTDELSSKTLECKNISGLYFIGEVVDVTGWLGGFNFQWAWASAHAAATSIRS
ncbi:MAG: NAD(P)/FAD-dependent oxidoreductase, partial [Oligoflexia bacterium]|nr:NAD(P)/FAD-dependent oxidoreductase [Oligoflexia bacterium]